MSEDRFYPFRRAYDWNVCGPARHDGKVWYQYWFHVGDVWELVDEHEVALPSDEEMRDFRKRLGDGDFDE